MKRWLVALLCGFVTMALGGLSSADEAKDPEGKTLFLKYRCNSCHTIDAAGIAKKAAEEDKAEPAAAVKKTADADKAEPAVAAKKTADADKAEPAASTAPKKKVPDLSSVGIDVKADWMVKFLKKQETTKEGKKHIKLFKGTDKELQTIAAWLETMKTEKSDKAAEKATATEKSESTEKATASESTEKAEKTEGAAETGSTEKTESTKPVPEAETK